MAVQRVRVVPATRPRGLICAAAVLGAMHAVILIATLPWLSELSIRSTPPLGWRAKWPKLEELMLVSLPVLGVAVVVVPAYLAVLLIARMRQRLWLAAACGALYGTMAMVVIGAKLWLTDRDQNGEALTLSWTAAPLSVGWEAVGGAIMGTAGFVLFYILIKATHFRLIEQSGLLCWKCAYEAAPSSERCPECGTLMDTHRFRAHWLVVGVRRRLWVSWIGLGLVLVAVTAAYAVVCSREQTPLSRQMAALTSGLQRVQRAQQGFTAGPTVSSNLVPWYPARDGSGRAIATCRPLGKSSPVRVMIMAPPGPKGSPTESMLLEGSTLVYAPLNGAQCDWIAEHGIPIALEQALLAAATSSGWAPPPPGTVTATSISWSSPKNSTEIDPGPFIPVGGDGTSVQRR